ncbi:UNVERIFIED_CONTAM: hypothetical protein K2H54_064826, partial [Gekko kuhli]
EETFFFKSTYLFKRWGNKWVTVTPLPSQHRWRFSATCLSPQVAARMSCSLGDGFILRKNKQARSSHSILFRHSSIKDSLSLSDRKRRSRGRGKLTRGFLNPLSIG